MPRAKTNGGRTVPPIVDAIVQPVARRLARMEALLIEMRHEQDVILKRSRALQAQFDTFAEQMTGDGRNIRRIRLPKK